MAESCVKSVTFFGTLQSVYNFISGSSQRWLVFKSKFPAFTLKPLSETRWAARFESVKAFRFQIGEVYDTLFELSTDLPDPESKFEAQTLANLIKDFSFLVSVVIWYELLFKVNLVSLQLQKSNIVLDGAIEEIERLTIFLLEFKENGFERSCNDAVELAEILDVEPEFKESVRLRQR